MILKVFAPLAQMQINYPKKFDKLLKEKGYSSVRNFIRKASSTLNKNRVYRLRKDKGTLSSLEKLAESLRIPLSN